jgi:hypothetical protein
MHAVDRDDLCGNRHTAAPRLTWNTRGHGLYVPGLLIWCLVGIEVTALAVLLVYAACRAATWAAHAL